MTKVAHLNLEKQVSPQFWLEDAVRKTQGIRHEVVKLTPELAKTLLGANFDNRSVRKTKVAQFAADMLAGQWALNGEPIIVSKDGSLNDGQHRCLACIDANTAVDVVFIFGVERSTRETVDQGSARSAGDIGSMRGLANAATATAIARAVISYERNEGKSFADANFITSAEILSRCESDPAISGAATFAVGNAKYAKSFMAGSLIGIAFYILAKTNLIEAELFLTRVARGDGLRVKDPAHSLRECLISRGKIGREGKIKLILQAWNIYRRSGKVAPNNLNSALPFPAVI